MSGEECGDLTDEFAAGKCVAPLVIVCHIWYGDLNSNIAAADVDFNNPTFIGSGERSPEKKQHSFFPKSEKHSEAEVKNEILSNHKSKKTL